MRTKEECKEYTRKILDRFYGDLAYEIIASDTASIHTVAEDVFNTVTADYPLLTDTDEENDIMTAAVYEVLREEHAEEIKRGERIQTIMKAITEDPEEFNEEYNHNVWDLAEYLTEYATEEKLKAYEKKYNL